MAEIEDQVAAEQSVDETVSVVEAFNEALNRHDVDAAMALMTEHCLFENTFPSPDGERFVGQTAVRGFWEQMLAASPHAHFDTEELFTAGDRCVVRWRYSWIDAQGAPGHVRGVDLFRIENGKIAEKRSYVKG